MTGRVDLPPNFPLDWDAPEFADGEIPALVRDEGISIITRQVALTKAGIRIFPDPAMLKSGLACYRLGKLFEEHRDVILRALRDARRREG